MTNQKLRVNQRIRCEGYFGWIRYIGQISTVPGTYFGIEWDDVSRGKHSGDYKGIPIFACRIPGTGSFVKEGIKVFESGIDFLAAIKSKYLEQDAEDVVLDFGGTNIKVETVGWGKITRKQSDLKSLREVGLKDMLICRRETERGVIGETCGNIEDLDLSKNLFESLEDVADICVELPRLSSLRVNYARFNTFTGLKAETASAFESIKVLSLSFTHLTWNEFVKLSEYLPNLEELHFAHNEISVMDETPRFAKLQLLNLEGNRITDFSQILGFGQLPLLHTLYLNDNQIQRIDAVKETEFKTLNTLNLNNNQLGSWSDIDNLNSFPCLTSIRVKDNPVLLAEEDAEKRHLFLIGRLSKADVINGSNISEKSRRQGEMYYMSHCTNTKNSFADQDEFARLNPRYLELLEKYDDPGIPVKQITTIREGLLNLTFSSGEKSLEKAVPLHLKIRALKAMVGRLFSQRNFELVLKTRDGREIPMDDDLRDLNFYSVEEGDAIVIM